MKIPRCILVAVAMTLLVPSLIFAQQIQCNTIQKGLIVANDGSIIKTGFDQWGYNYQAHMFNGLSVNYTRPVPPATIGLDSLIMKWSDAWLANVDCNGDGKLDRGLNSSTGLSDGISKGWLTNHYEGDYIGLDGELHHYTYFVKIIWVGPVPSLPDPDPWAGKRIWGQYAIFEEVNNDPYGGFHGVARDDLAHPNGLGFWTK